MRSYLRVSLPFVSADDGARFAEHHGATLNPTRARQRWWVDVDLEVDARHLDLAEIRQRYHALARIPASEHIHTRVWPIPDHDARLSDHLDALFDERDRQRAVMIGFYPTGAGWASAVVASAQGAIDLSASYIGDALGDLGALANMILRGDPIARGSFEEEPGAYRWVARRVGERVSLTISLFAASGRGRDEDGEPLLSVDCTAMELGAAVLACLDDVLARFGEDGYRALWCEHAFPTLERDALRRALPRA
ncbi:hypothetical protein DB30_07712 [Enhygromyxa salina]|uniref:Uncharacterized protein n=1 Tax=Enhygromyxa salina TaxID=215803 RepID=A0A0C2DGA1_9BACT|nr:hypothetical protein [Enhygromyxa salina]KIG18697.1 hypothetical protein DB30_07712 [Enhygromyxa salina]